MSGADEIQVFEPDAYREFIADKRLAQDVLPPLLERVHRRSLRDRITQPLPPVSWVWHGLVAEQQLAYLHGMGGLSKSLIAQAFAVTRQRGGFLLDRYVPPGGTVYLDAENDDALVDDRLRRLGAGVAAGGLEYHRVDSGLLGEAGEHLRYLLRHLIEEAAADVLILDSWASLWGRDEIDHQAVQAFFNVLNTVRVECRCAVLLIGHDNRRGDYRGLAVNHNSVQSRLHVRPTRKEVDAEEDGAITELTLWHKKQRSASTAPKTPFVVDWKAHRVALSSTLAHAGALAEVVKLLRASSKVVATQEIVERFGLSKNFLSERADQLHACGCERDREDDPRLSRGWRFVPDGLRGSDRDLSTMRVSAVPEMNPVAHRDLSTMRVSAVPEIVPLRGSEDTPVGNESGEADR